MTFILAVQLNDSIILASDNRMITILESLEILKYDDSIQKIGFWENGVITGTGDSIILDRVFQKLHVLKNIDYLPIILQREKERRLLEIGEHPQITKTSIVYSNQIVEQNYIGLHTVSSMGQSQTMHKAFKPMEMNIFIYNENIKSITDLLIDIKDNLIDRRDFMDLDGWVDYYLFKISKVFKTFSL